MSAGWLRAGVAAAWLALLLSALGVVYARHEARKLFAELQTLAQERDELDIEWGRLRIEQSTWATHARVERMARERLDMRVPGPADVQIIAE